MATEHKLFIVKLYCSRINGFARILLTANSMDDAERIGIENLGDNWTVHYSEFVCHTTTPVYKEL